MNFLLQKHKAKHIYRIPDGLGELCTDISREVLREQPKNIYGFIADYLEALLITRENAKVALKVVRNIIDDSESIIAVLKKTGLSFKQIAVAAPQLQKIFRDYLDAVNINSVEKEAEEKGEEKRQTLLESEETIQAVDRFDVINENSDGVEFEKANEAAFIIQKAFRRYCEKKTSKRPLSIISSKSLVVGSIINHLNQRLFDNISEEELPEEFQSHDELSNSLEKIQLIENQNLKQREFSDIEDFEYYDNFSNNEEEME